MPDDRFAAHRPPPLPSDLRIPSELSASPPRSVRARRIGPYVFVFIFLFGGFLFNAGCIAEAVFFATSSVVEGTVTRLATFHRNKGGLSYNVYYTYPAGAHRISDSASVDHSKYMAIHPGDSIPVRALVYGSLQFSEPDASQSGYIADRFLIWIFALLWTCLTLFLMRITWSGPRRLIREGQAVIGEIIDKKIVRSSRNTKRQLIYQYQPPTEQVLRGKMAVRSAEYDSVAPGDSVIVVYDPQRPQRSLLYDCADFAAY